MRSGELLHNDGIINYHIDGHGTPVVFIHGFTLDHKMWHPQIEAFTQVNTIITYDARGFGESTTPTGPYGHAEDLNALLEHLEISQAHIVGLSMGGRVATNFALNHPNKVLSLTLMDAALDGYQNTVNWNVLAKQQGIENARINWLNHAIFSTAKEQPDVLKNLSDIVDGYSGWHWLNDDPQTTQGAPARERLAEISAPALVIVGEKDLGYFHDIADVLANEIPGAQKVTIAGAGHMVNMEAPQKINELLAKFISAELDLPQRDIVY
jgi:3-oxoadipate enol-lactonase